MGANNQLEVLPVDPGCDLGCIDPPPVVVGEELGPWTTQFLCACLVGPQVPTLCSPSAWDPTCMAMTVCMPKPGRRQNGLSPTTSFAERCSNKQVPGTRHGSG